MKILLCALAAVAGLPTSAAQRPQGPSCDVLPGGFCHDRTTKDKEFVRQWNENKGKGNNNGRGNGNVRRRLVDLQDPPSTYVPFAPAEYEPVEGILLAYDTWDLDVVAGIAAAVTSQITETKVYMVTSSAAQKGLAESSFDDAGVVLSRVIWIDEVIDSVWIRDYGPRVICDPGADLRETVDTRYYTGRPNDDTFPTRLANGNDVGPHINYDLNDVVMHSGGNGHYFSTKKAFVSKLLLSDNRGVSEADLKQYWLEYKGAELYLLDRLNKRVDGTGHIDMWFLPVDDNTVIIGEWETEDNFGSKAITDNAASYMISEGYNVYRVPNWNGEQQYGRSVHYTYTNAVIANDVVVISSYGEVSNGKDDIAKATFVAAFPGKTIVQVDSSRIIERSGALHCIMQHVYDCSGSDPQTAIPPPTTGATTPTTTTTTTTTTITSNSGPISCVNQGPAGCQVGETCSGGCKECCCDWTNLGGGNKACNS